MGARDGRVMPLAFVKDGEVVRIISVDVGPGFARRLSEMGLIPGAVVKVSKAEGPGPVVVEPSDISKPTYASCPWAIKGFGCPFRGKIAIGFGVAMRILVEPVSG